jgi:protein involved in polysaccharide export with SLBB domain
MMKRFSTLIVVAIVMAGCISAPHANSLDTGDSLRVVMTGLPEPQTLECTIDREGQIRLPFLDTFPAAGRTTSELEFEIKKAYSEFDVGRGFQVKVTRTKKQ